ncbi:MAG: DUF1570 domain-containing protein [Pirellulaceae bacterium]
MSEITEVRTAVNSASSIWPSIRRTSHRHALCGEPIRWWRILFVLAVTLLVSVRSSHSQPAPPANAQDFGLRLETGEITVGDGRKLLVTQNDQPTVGLFQLQSGRSRVLVMPDGSLQAFQENETTESDRPFEPIGKEELAKQLTEGPFPGFQTRTTRRYLYVYNSSDAFAIGTSRILETMYPGLLSYCRKMDVPVEEPEYPLVVIIFRTQDEFDKYRKMPEGVIAYYNAVSNRIVMYEQSRFADVAPELALKQAISTIAHEGVHQILHNIGTQKRMSNWPLWVSEGLAEYFAPTDVGRRIRWKGVGHVQDLRLHELVTFYRTQPQFSTQGKLLRQTIESNNLNSMGYATSWALVSYLAKHERRQFAEFFRDVSQLEPLGKTVPGQLFEKHFDTDYARLEQELVRYLNSLPYTDPIANQTHYVLMIKRRDRREALITSSPAELEKMATERTEGSVYQVRSFANRQLAEVFSKRWLKN